MHHLSSSAPGYGHGIQVELCVTSGRHCQESWVPCRVGPKGGAWGRWAHLGEGRGRISKGDGRLSSIASSMWRDHTCPVTPVPDTAPGIQWVLSKYQWSDWHGRVEQP